MRQQMLMAVLTCHHICIAKLSKTVTKHESW